MSTTVLKFDPTHPAAHRLAAPAFMQALGNLCTSKRRVYRSGGCIVFEYYSGRKSLTYPVPVPGYDATASSDEQAIAIAAHVASDEFKRQLDEAERLTDALLPFDADCSF